MGGWPGIKTPTCWSEPAARPTEARRVKLAIFLLSLLLAVFAGLAAADEVRFKAYDTGLLDTRSAAEAIRGLLSPAGRVTEDPPNHRVIVHDTPAAHARIAAALAALAIPGNSVRIFVRRESEGARESTGGAVATDDGRIQIIGSDRESRSAAASTVEILVGQGGFGSIKVAEQTPNVDWFLAWGAGEALWTSTTRFAEIGTSLTARPVILDDGRIRVTLVPTFSYVADGVQGTVEVARMATEVVVRPDEEVRLGSASLGNRAFTEHFLAAWDASHRVERISITLRATIE